MSQIPVVVQHAPRFTALEAERLVLARYGVEGRAEPLPSERDQNFRISCRDGRSFVLKIANTTEREDILDFQDAALAHLARHAPSLPLPAVVPDLEGRPIGRVRLPEGPQHFVRLLTWVPGRVLAGTRPHSRALLAAVGAALGEMDRALQSFEHPAMYRPLQWDLARSSWIREELPRFDEDRRALLARVLDRFESHALTLAALRRQAIHNDWNDFNVVVDDSQSGTDFLVAHPIGVVDFGDMLHSWTVADLAVACTYAMLGKPDPIGAAAVIVGGYHDRLPLLEDELEVLGDLIRARLAISVTMSACQSAQAPHNEYLRVSERQGWELLSVLDATAPGWAIASFRRACALPATRSSQVVRQWLVAHQREFGPLVDQDLRSEAVAVLDLSVGSLDIPNVSIVQDLAAFCSAVDARIRASGARVGIGRYDEARLVYVSELFRHASNWEPENRTIHIGIDVFLPPGSQVRAPLDGVVHSFRDNRGAGDYGPTIILEHVVRADEEGIGAAKPAPSKFSPGLVFYTLYGHLSADSLPGLRQGMRVRKGEVIARLGDPDVNGGWPPHLHFQVITDLLGRHGDFPGVAAPSEREVWADLCPDPNLVLGIPADRFPPRSPGGGEILSVRRQHLGPSLSVSYRRPLTIVRGHGQYLFDADGRRYLDAVNNVPHVGHSHPRVVEAAARQLAVLSTNTRYLHPVLASYVERLAGLMPDPLSVCFIVCSGSEANELALRLARTYTGRKGVVVVDGAYHGNTSSLVEISPYKFAGPGGGGCPPHVRVAPMPDIYRGEYRVGGGDSKCGEPACPTRSEAGARYARRVSDAARELAASEHGLSAFFCESILSCGGQIVLPDAYLPQAYAAVRAAGGVCVADEVQVGFGRTGSHLWAFETQGVVPDIVTLGKPIGNGFPLAAVVTTRAIADAFANGMEYFNTFGGSQAACAAGHAVLDVLRDERLQEHALSVGQRFRSGLEELKRRFEVVGDVRGIGLFLGVELVRSRQTLEPAPAQADYVVNRMREQGVLVSTDGPQHNVLKIKPPMPFGEADTDRFVTLLAATLDEEPARPRASADGVTPYTVGVPRITSHER